VIFGEVSQWSCKRGRRSVCLVCSAAIFD
jgi:hypothetical protein